MFNSLTKNNILTLNLSFRFTFLPKFLKFHMSLFSEILMLMSLSLTLKEMIYSSMKRILQKQEKVKIRISVIYSR